MQDAVPLRASRFKLRYVFLALFAVAVAAGVGTGLYLWLRGGDGGSVRVVTAVQISAPEGWSEQPLTDADRNAGLLLSLDRDQPDASFLARTVIASLAPDFSIGQLVTDTEAALSDEIEDFDLIGSSVVTLGSFEAVQVGYRQADDSGVQHQVLMTIIPTANQTFYLTLRAERREFRQVEDDGGRMIDAFVSQVAGAIPQD